MVLWSLFGEKAKTSDSARAWKSSLGELGIQKAQVTLWFLELGGSCDLVELLDRVSSVRLGKDR